MPAYEIALPKDSYNVKLRKKWSKVEIPIDIDAMGFTRTGEDGTVTILPLFGGDEMVGKVLEGHWKKFWSTGMDADQAFTAILDGAGILQFQGEADVAGIYGYGKITSNHVLPLVDGLELQVSMEVPVDDTGATADRDLLFGFILNKNAPRTGLITNDSLKFEILVDETGLLLRIVKGISGAFTNLAFGYDYTMDKTRGTGDLEGVIWRITIHDGHYGTGSPSNAKHMHVYLKQSDTIANAEGEDENEITGSPFDISDILFEVAYPEYLIGSQNTAYFDSGGEAKSTYVKVDYNGDIEPIYEVAPADQLLNEVELWDGDPDTTGVKVYDVDHTFANNTYLQNGLIRHVLQDGVNLGNDIYGYISAVYRRIVAGNRFYVRTDAIQINYHWFEKIIYLSPEKCTLQIKSTDTSTNDDNIFVRWTATMKRGNPLLEITTLEIYPVQDAYWTSYNIGNEGRFGWVGNHETDMISDDDLDVSALNTELPDNLMVSLDDEGSAGLAVFGAIKYPVGTGSRFYMFDGGGFFYQDVPFIRPEDHVLYLGLTPFALVANLFEQTEDGSIGDAGTVTDAAADPLLGADNAVQLNAIGNFQTPAGEYSAYTFTAGTHLPAGRYLAVVRARYVDEETMNLYVWNDSDDEYRNEENAKVTKTLAVTYGYHSLVFDITATDVSGTDAFAIVVEKSTDDADEIRTDYVLIVPIGDGQSFPQDLSHNALRDMNKNRRIVKK